MIALAKQNIESVKCYVFRVKCFIMKWKETFKNQNLESTLIKRSVYGILSL